MALAAVVVFWMVGAHNRLVRLRGAVAQAFSQVEEALQRRGAAAAALAEAVREPLQTEQVTLQALFDGLAAVARAAEALRLRPTDRQAVAALAASESELSAALTRVGALVEHRMELAVDPAVAPHRTSVTETGARLAFARQLFNDAVQAYNEALQAFPTRLLVRLFGMGPGSPL